MRSDLELMIDGELTLPVAGFPGYRLSESGSLFSAWKNIGKQPRVICDAWKRMSINVSGRYSLVGLRRDGETHVRLLHRLMLESFIGPCPPGLVGCHCDGNRKNNSISNLRWDTRSANEEDKNKHGTAIRGQYKPLAKLSEADVFSIRNEYGKGGYTQRALGDKYKVSQVLIGRIVRREIWRHI